MPVNVLDNSGPTVECHECIFEGNPYSMSVVMKEPLRKSLLNRCVYAGATAVRLRRFTWGWVFNYHVHLDRLVLRTYGTRSDHLCKKATREAIMPEKTGDIMSRVSTWANRCYFTSVLF